MMTDDVMTWMTMPGTVTHAQPPGMTSLQDHMTNRLPQTAVTIGAPNEQRRKRKRVRKEKMDMRARCFTCLCLILITGVGLGIVALVLMSESNTGIFSNDVTTTEAPDVDMVDCNFIADTGSPVTEVHPPDVGYCITVESAIPSCRGVLPYEWTTSIANSTNTMDAYFFDIERACHDDWIFFICVYVLPECKQVPPIDWKPLCICPEFHAKIYTTKCKRKELNPTKDGLAESRLTCEGRVEPIRPNCLEPEGA